MTRSLQPELREFAPANLSPWAEYEACHRLSDPIVRSDGFAGHPHAYSLFNEMEDKDPHLFSALQTRKLGVLARRCQVEPAGDGERDRAIGQWVGSVLGRTCGWRAGLMHLLDALGKGMAVLEVLWGFDADGRIVPQGLKPRAAERFSRANDGGWRLANAGAGFSPALASASDRKSLPPRKFIFGFFGQSDDRPYGKGLLEKVFWLWWFKKHNLKFWLVYNEKFGTPTVLARHRPGLNETERDRLLEVIDAIQNSAGLTVPEGITIELLEPTRGGGADTYRHLAQWCNDEMSRAILGQTLTGSEGARSGSLALAQVHETVRQDYMKADAWLLMDAINSQLVRWLVDFNFGEDVPAPKWTIDLSPELDLESEVKIDHQLLQMGVALPEGYFYEKYGRPAPTEKTRGLQYDDANLYQYHLQFGILTINEVREKLGLPAVPWGDKPTTIAEDPNKTRKTRDAASEGLGKGNETNLEDERKRLERSEK